MRFLNTHAPKLMFLLVAATCVVFTVFCTPRPIPLDHDRELALIDRTLRFGGASPQFAYGAAALERLQYHDAVAASEHLLSEPLPLIGWHVAFPQPSRPLVYDNREPIKCVDTYASLDSPKPEQAFAKADRAVIEFQIPKHSPHITPLRIEIFRATAEASIDTRAPYAAVSLVDPEPAPVPVAPAPFHPRRPPPPPPQPLPVPANPTFHDKQIQPRTAYHYAFRIIGRMNTPPNTTIARDADGNVVRTSLHAPRGFEIIGADRSLYAGPISEPIEITTRSNCEVRLTGIIGSLPAEGAPKPSSTYKGQFAVRVWLSAIQEWKEQSVYVEPGQRIEGNVIYKDPQTRRPVASAFNTGLELVEIKRGEITHAKSVDVMRADDHGKMIADPGTGIAVRTSQELKGESIPISVAVLRDIATCELSELRAAK
ncbi:MAG TPA: hypothetical protein VGP72_28635 [Planctomycetota bacterium]